MSEAAREAALDDVLVFSVETQNPIQAVELLFAAPTSVEVDDTATPLMQGGIVSRPVIVFKEGDHATVRRDGKAVKFPVTKERMELWVRNTRRDVPLNYDHVRRGGPNTIGWLRMASAKAFVDKDPKDGKWALFAQPEFAPEAAGYLAAGQYRDLSMEIDPVHECAVGLALCNYPRLKTIHQFSEVEPERAQEENETMTITPEQFAELQARLAAVEAERDEARIARAAAEKAAARSARVAQFGEQVNALIAADNSPIPVAIKDDVLELMVFAAEAGENYVCFSEVEGKDNKTPLELVTAIFAALETVAKVEADSQKIVGDKSDEDTSPYAGIAERVRQLKPAAK